MAEEKKTKKAPAKKAPAKAEAKKPATAPKAGKKEAAPKAAAPAPAAKKEAPKAKKPAGKTITVRQVGSPIGRSQKQLATLKGLGLNKMHRTRTLEDTPAVRGMVNAIPHLVEIVGDAA